jgi:hypothetical protein
VKSIMLGLLTVGLLTGPIAAQAASVIVGDRAWRQLTETVNLTWDQIATVCDVTSGACSGSLTVDGVTVSFAGWTWAANPDIQALFDKLIQPGAANFPTDTSHFVQPDSADIKRAVAGAPLFEPTFVRAEPGLEQRGAEGWSRTTASPPDKAHVPGLAVTIPGAGAWPDNATLGGAASKKTRDKSIGVWLYKAAPLRR